MKRGSTPLIERQPMLEGLGKNSWFTPEPLFKELETLYGPFTLDVAADEHNTKCPAFFTEEQNGLTQKWHGRVWCNPPYTKLLDWVRKAHDETRLGHCEIAVLLLPAHTSTAWFHDFALPYAELYWIRGKRKFGGQRGTAIMPSVAVVFRAGDQK